MNGMVLSEENSLSLNLPNISVSSGGMYTCNISNAAGSDSGSVTVNVRPRFTSLFEDLLRVSGDPATLVCEAESFPKATYSWRRQDRVPIRGGIPLNSSMLVFDSVAFGDEGDYVCTATSAGETIQSEAVTLTSELP